MGRFLAFLILLAAVAAGVGYYRGWFKISVDEGQIKHDTQAAQEKVKELGQEAKQAVTGEKTPAGPTTASGQIKQLAPTGDHLILETADKTDLTVYLDAATKVTRNNKPTKLRTIKPGEKAEVVYQAKDGKNVAQSITLHR